MPAFLNFLKGALEKGEIRVLALKNNQWLQPPTGRKWLILYGTYYHVTGTDTIFAIKKAKVTSLSVTRNNLLILAYHAGAVASGYYNLFHMDALVTGIAIPNNQIIIVRDDQYIHSTGDASVTGNIVVLEW